MKIYTQFDCITPTAFEETILLIVKGAIYDFWHSSTFFKKDDQIVNIKINEIDGGTIVGGQMETPMMQFIVENSAPGLFKRVKKAIDSSVKIVILGEWEEQTRITKIIISRN